MIANKIIPQDLVEQMIKDKKIRVAIIRESFQYFFNFYYPHYVKYPTADFQKEVMHLLEKSDKNNLFVVAFRGSGKSTIITTAYPIWSILGKQQKKCIVIFCQTQAQAKQHMMNLRSELENNELLKKDLGPFREDSDEWGSHSLVFSNTNARITVASVEQSVRGLRHHEHRPDLIICDDVEDMASTKNTDSRDKTYQWLKGEVIPTGDKNTRLIIVGNLLHQDSLLMRLKNDINNKLFDGDFLCYPLIDNNGKCLWPGKYPSEQDIEAERKKIGDEVTWQREYILNIIPDEGQLIKESDLYYYDELPNSSKLRNVVIGIDLAISQKTTADCTAMVCAKIYGSGKDAKIYILPNPVNKRILFPDIVKEIVLLHNTFGSGTKCYVESVAAQEYLVQNIRSEYGYINIQGVTVAGADKRSRLAATTHRIQSGNILFPKYGVDALKLQLLGFGIEKHDDLADAFSLLVNASTKDLNRATPEFLIL